MNNCFLNIVHMTVYAWTKILETKEFLKIIEIAALHTRETGLLMWIFQYVQGIIVELIWSIKIQ